MSLPFPPSPLGDWSAVVGAVLAPFFNAQIQIVNPNSASVTDYDPDTDTGDTIAPVLICTSPARITKVRFPKEAQTPVSTTGVSRFRFQLPRDPTRPFIPAGWQVIVTDGGKETQLEQVTYTVLMSLNDSWAPITTIECQAEITGNGDIAPAA